MIEEVYSRKDDRKPLSFEGEPVIKLKKRKSDSDSSSESDEDGDKDDDDDADSDEDSAAPKVDDDDDDEDDDDDKEDDDKDDDDEDDNENNDKDDKENDDKEDDDEDDDDKEDKEEDGEDGEDEEEEGEDEEEEEGEDEEEDEEEDDDIGRKYLQKMERDTDMKKSILKFHPEMKTFSNHQVNALTAIDRKAENNQLIIDDALHRTIPFLTKYEKARIIGERTKQLNDGAHPFIALSPGDNVIDGYSIALKEFDARAIPVIIKRPLPNGQFEFWKLCDLEYVC